MLTKRCGLVLKNGDWCCRKWGHTAQHQGSKAQARARENRRNNPEAPAQRRAAVNVASSASSTGCGRFRSGPGTSQQPGGRDRHELRAGRASPPVLHPPPAPGPPPDGPAQHDLYQQLSGLAGGSANVVSYCLHVLQPSAAVSQGLGGPPR